MRRERRPNRPMVRSALRPVRGSLGEVPSRRPLVLIVSDDDALGSALRGTLKDEGIHALIMTDAERTIEIVAQEQPDLVLLDADLGAVDARDLVCALKRNGCTDRIPIFLTSGRARHWGRTFALHQGAEEFLEKPLLVTSLARRIAARLQEAFVETTIPAPSPIRHGFFRSEVDRQQAHVLRVERAKRASSRQIRIALRVSERPVLVIEDDDDVRETLVEVLEDEGIPAVAAINGQHALDLLRSRAVQPSIILLDLMMPVMNGWEFRRCLETDASIPAAPVIVMSARSCEDTVGAVPWLQKPLRVADLLSTIRQMARV